jgi:hypothetical protein
MKSFMIRVILFGLILGSMTAVALAKSIKKQMTFSEPVRVNGVIVRPGTYDVAFDEETRELTIFKGKRVIARSPAQLEKLDEDSHVAYELKRDDLNDSEPKLLTRVGLKRRIHAKLLNGAGVKTESIQH